MPWAAILWLYNCSEPLSNQITETTYPDKKDLFLTVVVTEGDERKKSKGEQEAEDESEEVGEVVDPRQQTEDEQEEHDENELEQSVRWVPQHLPAVDHFHHEASEQPELRPCRTNLNTTNITLPHLTQQN